MARPLTHPELDYFLLSAIDQGKNADIAGLVATRFGLTRQAVNRHLRGLAKDGMIKATGSTRSRRYQLVEVERAQTYPLEGLAEHEVWEEFVNPQAQ